MKICLVNDGFPPVQPESGRIIGIATALEQLGHRVTLIEPGRVFASTRDLFARDGTSMRSRRPYYSNSIHLLETLRKFRPDLDSDILLVQIPFPLVKGLTLFFRKVPTTSPFLDVGDYWANTSIGAYRRFLDFAVFKLAMIARGTSVAGYALQRLLVQLGVPAERCQVLPNCVDFSIFKNDAASKRTTDRGRPTVAYLGTIRKDHGLDALPGIASKAVALNPQLRFLVIGSGPFLVELIERVTTLGLDEHFVFTGRVSINEVARYLERADIGLCLHPTGNMLTNMASPLKLPEYMAMGCVPITTGIQEARVMVKNGSNGYVCDVEDIPHVIDLVLRDPRKLASLKQEATNTAREQYDWRERVRGLVAFWIAQMDAS